jgi:glycosyltransferase involved in cell wall biosynthesis
MPRYLIFHLNAPETAELDPASGQFRLAADPASAVAIITGALASHPEAECLAFWDDTLGAFPNATGDAFVNSLDDAWHPGPLLGGATQLASFLAWVSPLWVYRLDPRPELAGAVNWKVAPRCLLLKVRPWRILGGLSPDFDTLAGAFAELGLRWFKHGAILRQQPIIFSDCRPPLAEKAKSGARHPAAVFAGRARPAMEQAADRPPNGNGETPHATLADSYRLVSRQFGMTTAWRMWLSRLLLGGQPWRELSVLTCLNQERTRPPHPPAAVPGGALDRDLMAVIPPTHPTISVILPTVGRYPYLSECLNDLRRQTIPPHEIIVIDGNPLAEYQPDFYTAFQDLPLTIIHFGRPGVSAPRNAGLERATGEFIWFVDDDSRLPPDNAEQHLRLLTAYGAEVSVGPATTPERPELWDYQRTIACTFMDCGTTLCTRHLLARTGGFDERYDATLNLEDADLGARFLAAGGLMLNNPYARRFHYKAPVGGCRAKRRPPTPRWSLAPRPRPAWYYYGRRHFARITALGGFAQQWVASGWLINDTAFRDPHPAIYIFTIELLALPLTLIKFSRSLIQGHFLWRQGSVIPRIIAP